MCRAVWKGAFIDKTFLKKERFKKRKILIWSRRSIITSNLIGKKLFVYNGSKFKSIFITRDKVGFKFGEFSTSHQQCKNKDKHAKKIKIKSKK